MGHYFSEIEPDFKHPKLVCNYCGQESFVGDTHSCTPFLLGKIKALEEDIAELRKGIVALVEAVRWLGGPI